MVVNMILPPKCGIVADMEVHLKYGINCGGTIPDLLYTKTDEQGNVERVHIHECKATGDGLLDNVGVKQVANVGSSKNHNNDGTRPDSFAQLATQYIAVSLALIMKEEETIDECVERIYANSKDGSIGTAADPGMDRVIDNVTCSLGDGDSVYQVHFQLTVRQVLAIAYGGEIDNLQHAKVTLSTKESEHYKDSDKNVKGEPSCLNNAERARDNLVYHVDLMNKMQDPELKPASTGIVGKNSLYSAVIKNAREDPRERKGKSKGDKGEREIKIESDCYQQSGLGYLEGSP
ncbi:UNVERIFIED_CONTAM: hypothetical protein HDU68_000093 [Siphonaria sp. JEL0065]|nr:hypothetical protein HDU68_000093 [Siphonaria sp. JEL0065]